MSLYRFEKTRDCGVALRVIPLLLMVLFLGAAGAPAGYGQNAPVRVTGKVVDETGAIMPAADVAIFQGRNAAPVVEGKTNGEGEFTLQVPAGEYRLVVSAPDFDNSTQTIRAASGMKPLSIELKVAGVVIELEVAAQEDTVTADPSTSVTGITMTMEELLDLPDNPDDMAAYLRQIAAGLPGTLDLDDEDGQFMIDGFQGGELPPKDQIASIRIIEDPSVAGGRRIEIVTRAGSGVWHGNMRLGFRDSALNARQPLTDRVKPNTQFRSYESQFSGPIIPGRLGGSFSLRNSTQEQGSQAIRAITPNGPFNGIVVSPSVTKGFSMSNMKLDLVPGKHSVTFAASYTTTKRNNSGVTGFNLPERATDTNNRNWNFQVQQNSTFGGKWANAWRLQLSRSDNRTVPVMLADPIIGGLVAVNVQDAFNGGSAQNLTRSQNTGFNLQNQLSTTYRKWTFRLETRLDRRHPINDSENNYQGTYTFSSLHDYCVASGFYGDVCQETLDIWMDAIDAGITPTYSVAGAFGSMNQRAITGVPIQFTQTTGDPRLEQRITTFQSQLTGEWRASQKFSLTATVRHNIENYLRRMKVISPTLQARYLILPRTTITVSGSVNMTPFNGGNYETILRTQAGARQSNIVILNPTYIPGQAPYDGLFQITPQATTVRMLAPDYRDPYNGEARVQLARQVARNLTANVTFSASRGRRLTRYRNINAPFPGDALSDDLLARLNATVDASCNSACVAEIRDAARAEVNAMRPDPSQGNLLQLETSGMSAQQALSFGMRMNNFNLLNQVRLSVNPSVNLRWAKDSPNNPVNQWNPMAEWGRSTNDQRLQFRTPININWFPMRSWKWQFTTNFNLSVNSGRPYNITSGRDDNGDTSNNDRPAGVLRNSGTAPTNYNLDLTFSKRFLIFAPPQQQRFTAFAEPQRGGGGGGGGGFGGGGGGGGGNSGQGGGGAGFAGGGGGGNRGGGGGNSSGTRSVTLQVQIQNLLNNTQLNAPSSVVTSRFFGTSTTAQAGRQISLNLQMNLF